MQRRCRTEAQDASGSINKVQKPGGSLQTPDWQIHVNVSDHRVNNSAEPLRVLKRSMQSVEPGISDGLFLYPAQPPIIANTIESAIQDLRIRTGSGGWLSWKDLGVSGQIIFCQVCKGIRFSKLVVADVTTLNFNLLFEIGYSVGIGIPVLPIRDTSSLDNRAFDELGLLDTLGYLDYQNSSELSQKIRERGIPNTVISQIPALNREQPLYVTKTHTQTEGLVHLMSA